MPRVGGAIAGKSASPDAGIAELAARQHAVVSRRQLLELVREAGLPLPVVNARIAGYEVDFHWPAARLIVETDGRETHDTPHQFEEDRRRDLALSLAGWRVVRLTWRQVTREPETVVALLRSLLASIL